MTGGGVFDDASMVSTIVRVRDVAASVSPGIAKSSAWIELSRPL
jgi:hypothetical protein